MREKKYIIYVLILISNLVTGQENNRKELTEEIINTILLDSSISTKIFDKPLNITNYEFEGDYSVEKIFPKYSKIQKLESETIIQTTCVNSIKFKKPIWKVLKTVDENYDSLYYKKQIQNADKILWSKRKLEIRKKEKFVKWKWRKFHKETNHFSSPIFNKNKDIAFIKFSSTNWKSMVKKKSRILIYKKIENKWILIETVESKNYG